jgi:hypothetical protein
MTSTLSAPRTSVTVRVRSMVWHRSFSPATTKTGQPIFSSIASVSARLCTTDGTDSARATISAVVSAPQPIASSRGLDECGSGSISSKKNSK